jgi:hypothetical protein
MLVRAKRQISPGNLVAADQKLLAGLNQDGRRDRLFDPGDMLELGQKLPVLLVS